MLIVELKLTFTVDGVRLRNLFRAWRWLELGEYVQLGDQVCAKGVKSVTVIFDNPWMVYEGSHPVRTKRPEKVFEPPKR